MADPTETNKHSESALPKDNLVETKHEVTIDGKTIRYTVTCGTIVLKEEREKSGDKSGEFEGEKPRATIFFVAYTRDDVDDKTKRPITFSFNGGPGSSSVWLHLGALGPRRVEMGDAGNVLPPPYRLVPNEHTLLDVTDLVFIDPVGTGYSRPVEGEKAKQFHSLKKDIESVGDFIRLYATRYRRWSSPKFLAGESYGTTRAAGLSGYLQERHGMYLNGLILVSSVLDFATLITTPGNDLPFVLYLPTYTATAWYHKRLAPDLQRNLRKAVDEARKFAQNEYALALLKGDALGAKDRVSVVKKLARLTGLSSEYIERTDLRIYDNRFYKELLRGQAKTVGRLDSRFTGYDRDSAGENIEDDPSYSAIIGPYAGALNDYIRGELNYENDLPYEILSLKVNANWNFDAENQFTNVQDALRKAITSNPTLRVFIANGYYDVATPFFATEYTFSHLGLPPPLRKNVSMAYYEAGHMMYVHLPSLALLKKDMARFVEAGER
jgi:carboxypeptidase C (cathepsin A)